MSGTGTYTKWSQQTFDFIQKHSEAIKNVGNSGAVGGISAAALAGAMAKECQGVLSNLEGEQRKDFWAMVGLACHPIIAVNHSVVEALGLVDSANKVWKILFPVLVDMGPFNTQGSTAIRALEKYTREHPSDDPLDLKKYSGNYGDFLWAVTGLWGSEDESVRVAAAIWGLRMAEAKEWFESKFFTKEGLPDLQFMDYWNGLEQETKDALYGQWVISGPAKMEERYEENVAEDGYYDPRPGVGAAGGWDILKNSADIGLAMDISWYGVDPELFNVEPDDIEMPLPDDPPWLLDILDSGLWDPRPYSILMPFGNPGEVDLSEVESRLRDSELSVPQLASIALRLPRLGDWLDPESQDQEEWVRSRIDDALKSFLDAQENAAPPARRDPLILDLGGNGIKTTTINTGTYFDYDANGLAERTAWVSPEDGFLVLDRNGDGKINDGRELFGDQTVLISGKTASNGFEALAELDVNKDGRIDFNDPAYAQLKVWQDEDGDGISSVNELHALSELEIAAINLNSTPTIHTDPSGNTQIRSGSFVSVDGNLRQIAEYRLQRNATYNIPDQWVDVPEDIVRLPDLLGYGNVYDLHQAMARDTSGELKSLVQQFAGSSDPAARNALMDLILFKWTASDSINPTSRGNNIDARRLSVLEKFFGQSFIGANGSNPTSQAAIALNDSYRLIREMTYAQLMAQTHLKGFFENIIYTWDEESKRLRGDLSNVIGNLQAGVASNPELGKELLSEFARSIRGLGGENLVNYLSFRETFLQQDPDLNWVIDTGGLPVYDRPGQGIGWPSHINGTDNADAVKGSLTLGDGWINGQNGNDVIYGTDRDEHLFNQTGDALLYGGGGNDELWAGEGDDILDGGTGNDRLFGEAGNDTYMFRRGSGQDIIIDPDPTADNTDTVWLGSNLTPDEVVLRRSGNNLVLKIIDTTDTLTVQDYFRNDSPLNRIEQIQFMDGTLWTHEDILIEIVKPSVAEGAWVRASEWNAGFCHALGGEPGALRESFGWGAGGSIAG